MTHYLRSLLMFGEDASVVNFRTLLREGEDRELGDGVHLYFGLTGGVGGCVIAGGGKYRPALWRIWDPDLPLWFMGLTNPSKATHMQTDPTITRQVERVRRGGAGGLVVGNAADVRETDRLKAAADPEAVSSENAAWLRWLAAACTVHIVGWGPDAQRAGWHRAALEALSAHDLYALRVNADGSPGHPLYIGYDVAPMPYRERKPA